MKLIYYLILIIGLVFLSLPNYFLSIFIVTSMISSVILILFVIYEIDSLKISDTEVYVNPYNDIVNFIKKSESKK